VNKINFTELTLQVVKAAPEPLTFAEIFERVQARGPITTKNPKGTIRNAIGQSRLIVATGDGRYGWKLRVINGSVLRLTLSKAELKEELFGSFQRIFDLEEPADLPPEYQLDARRPRAWDRASEIGSPWSDAQRHTHQVTLDLLALRPNRKFLYLFDYGDNHQFDIRVRRVNPAAPAGQYPRLVASQGENLPQYPDDDEDLGWE
jgi:hypothetical protein